MIRATGRRTPLYGFLLADAISLSGARVSMIAIPWLVLTTTGSAAQTGLVAFAGALVALARPANALIVDALSLGLCAAVFAWSTSAMGAQRVDDRPPGTTYVQELREGWTFLRKDPVLVSMSSMVAVTNLLDL